MLIIFHKGTILLNISPFSHSLQPIPRRFAEGSKQLHPKNLFESPSPHEEEELFERDTSPNDSMPQSQESLRAQTSARGRSISTKSFTDLDDNKANNANLKKRNSIPSQYEENQSPTGPSPLTGSAGQFAVPTGRPSQSSKGLSGSSKRRQIQLPPASSTPPDSDTDHQTWKELRQNQRLLGEREKSLNEREEQLREREQAAEAREEQLLMVGITVELFMRIRYSTVSLTNDFFSGPREVESKNEANQGSERIIGREACVCCRIPYLAAHSIPIRVLVLGHLSETYVYLIVFCLYAYIVLIF